MQPVVMAKGVRKSYGTSEVVRGIDFEVRPGECFGILGPNGAGKTTLIKMLICFSPLGEGELRVFGQDVRLAGRTIKRRLGVVPQEDSLDPDLSVFENLVTFAGYFDIPGREARRRAQELIAFMQLEAKVDDKIAQLSGGLCRRLTIARALINQPELLVLDEPTTGLDPQARLTIWHKLRGLKSQGMSMILTTHYMDEAERLCDRLIVLDQGRILAEGTPVELISRYVGEEALEFHGASLDGDLPNQLRARGLHVETSGDTVFAFSQNGPAQLDAAAQALHPQIRRRATLEDVFLRLTGRDLRE